MGSRALFAFVGGFLAGVLLHSLFPIGVSFAVFSALLGSVSTVFSIQKRKRVIAIITATTLFGCAFGILRMDAVPPHGDPTLAAHLGSGIALEGYVNAEPDVREASVRIPVHVEAILAGSTTIPVEAGVLVLAPAHTTVFYGDHVHIEGKLRLPESFDTGFGRVFNYPAFLAKDGISYELAFAQVDRIGGNNGDVLTAAAIRVKQIFLDGLGRSLPEPASGLAGGITAGDKRGIGQDLSDTFRHVGLVHVVVLSGYNIMIVIEAVTRVLVWMRAPRFLKFGSSIFIALLFSLMTGGASASVRAALMAVIAVIGRASGRLYIASRALAVVAFVMVFWNPLILAFDPGFQLSVLATAGLIAFTPIVAPRLEFITTRFGLRETAAATISTQLAVLPLLLYQNGQLPIYSLPVNLLALAAVPPAMLFSSIASLAGLFLGPIAPIVAIPALVLLSYILLIAQFFGNLPFATISIPAFSAWLLVPMYLLLFGSVLLRKQEVQLI